MHRMVWVGTFAAAVAVVAAVACGSDSVASPTKAVSTSGGTDGNDSSGTTTGDTSSHGSTGHVRWLTITPQAASLQLHNYLAFHATLYDTNGTPMAVKITWRSSDDHIATVSDTGLVHGVGLGVVAIFASADGVNDSAEVAIVDTAVNQPAQPPDTGTVPDSTHRPPPPDSGAAPDSSYQPPPPPPPDTAVPGDTNSAAPRGA